MSVPNTKRQIQDHQTNRNPAGIGGWLILPAIGIVVSLLLGIIYTLINLISLGKIMRGDYGPYYFLKIVVNIGILFYLLTLALRFFTKRRNVPQTFIRLIVIKFAVSTFFFIVGLVVFGSSDILVLTSLLLENFFIAWGIVAAIWIPYFKVSKRVKATFIIQEDSLPYKVVLPIRYLISRRISWLAFSAVALCVFIVVVVMTVMTGLVSDFKQRNHRFVGDCVVGTESLVGFAYYEDFMDILERSDCVEAVSPVIKSFALKRRRDSDQDSIVEIMGIDPGRHSQATSFGTTLHYNRNGASKAFEPAYDANLPGCVIGDVLFRNTDNVYSDKANLPRIAYSISCFPLTSRGALAQAGTDLVDTKTFYYSDLSSSNLPRIDAAFVYLPFEQTQLLCGMGGPTKRVSWLHIKLREEIDLQDGCDEVRSLWQKYQQQRADEPQAYLLETVSVQSWKEYRRESIAPMEQEQTLMGIMFIFVGITTVFIILVVFYMIISHKSKDIGILKSIGTSGTDIIQLFSGFAFIIGLLGSVVGLLAGWLFLLNINRIENWLYVHFKFQLWDRSIYAIGNIPNRIEPNMLIVIGCSAILACLIGAFVPSWQAARRKPVEILQVNQV